MKNKKDILTQALIFKFLFSSDIKLDFHKYNQNEHNREKENSIKQVALFLKVCMGDSKLLLHS